MPHIAVNVASGISDAACRRQVPRQKLSILAIVAALVFLAALFAASARPGNAQSGTWTHVNTNPYDGFGTTMLLTDGTLMALGGNNWHNWWRLAPDANGSYANGTWSARASSITGRLYFPSSVLRDGRVIVCGGEYISEGDTPELHNRMEVYDPVADAWTAGPDGLFGGIGDVGAKVLPDGRFLCSTWNGPQTQIWDPANPSVWTQSGNKATNTTGDEESWALLPDATILDAEDNPGEKYIPWLGRWITIARCPVPMTKTGEIGPFVLLYDGQCFCISETGQTALYTSGANPTEPGSWQIGPTFPNGQVAGDVPGCIEPNGKVLCVAAPALYGTASFYEYDPASNALTAIPGPTGVTFGRSDILRLLALPTGQIFLSAGGADAWVYTPVGGPQSAWRPTVSGVTYNGDGSYKVTGTQLNGLTEGGAYGDDAYMSTNYPLVRLVDAQGRVHYCRTFNHSTMALATGNAPVSTNFTPPAGLPHGVYTLYVVANGIPSAPYTFQYGLGIYGITIAPLTQTTATVNWQTTSPADSAIDFGPNTAYGTTVSDTTLVTSHSLTLTGLTTGGVYHLQIRSSDGNGHTANSGDLAFRTALPPPLQISNIVVSAITGTSAKISWTTNYAADSVVDYGVASAFGVVATGVGGVTSHSVTLTGLKAGTVYYFAIHAMDAQGDTAVSKDESLTTVGVQIVVSESSASSSSATGSAAVKLVVRNTGAVSATHVVLKWVVMGTTACLDTMPQALGTLSPGASTTVTVHFPSGAYGQVRWAGVYDGGAFGNSSSVGLNP